MEDLVGTVAATHLDALTLARDLHAGAVDQHHPEGVAPCRVAEWPLDLGDALLAPVLDRESGCKRGSPSAIQVLRSHAQDAVIGLVGNPEGPPGDHSWVRVCRAE